MNASIVTLAADVKRLVDKSGRRTHRRFKREITGPELKRLIESAMSEEMHADFSYMNQGGVRDRLPQGKLLARCLWNIMPFDNKMVTGKFEGSQLSQKLTGGRAVDPAREYIIAMSDFSAGNESERKLLGIEDLQFQTHTPLPGIC